MSMINTNFHDTNTEAFTDSNMKNLCDLITSRNDPYEQPLRRPLNVCVCV